MPTRHPNVSRVVIVVCRLCIFSGILLLMRACPLPYLLLKCREVEMCVPLRVRDSSGYPAGPRSKGRGVIADSPAPVWGFGSRALLHSLRLQGVPYCTFAHWPHTGHALKEKSKNQSIQATLRPRRVYTVASMRPIQFKC